MAARPKPVRISLPLERLAFDGRLQLRIFPEGHPPGQLWREEVVADILETITLDEHAHVDALCVVEEQQKKGQPTYWLYGGFHRAEAFRRAGRNSVDCLVTKGSFFDALYLALGQNGPEHGHRRTPDECRRAVVTLLDNPAMLERARQDAPGTGGLHRAIARACGVGRTLVADVLKARGQRVEANRLVAAATPPQPPEPQKSNDDLSLSVRTNDDGGENDDAESEGDRPEAGVPVLAATMAEADPDLLSAVSRTEAQDFADAAMRHLKGFRRLLAEKLPRPAWRDAFREALRARGWTAKVRDEAGYALASQPVPLLASIDEFAALDDLTDFVADMLSALYSPTPLRATA